MTSQIWYTARPWMNMGAWAWVRLLIDMVCTYVTLHAHPLRLYSRTFSSYIDLYSGRGDCFDIVPYSPRWSEGRNPPSANIYVRYCGWEENVEQCACSCQTGIHSLAPITLSIGWMNTHYSLWEQQRGRKVWKRSIGCRRKKERKKKEKKHTQQAQDITIGWSISDIDLHDIFCIEWSMLMHGQLGWYINVRVKTLSKRCAQSVHFHYLF